MSWLQRRKDAQARADSANELMQRAEKAQDIEIDSQIRYGADLTRKVSRWNRLRWSYFTRDHDLPRQVQRTGTEKVSTFPTFAREAFTRLISGDDVEATDNGPEEKIMVERLHGLLDDLPEWKRLIERCAGDEYSAGLGASSLLESVIESTPQHKHDLRNARLRLSALEGDIKRGQDVDQEMLDQFKAEYEQAQKEAQAHASNVDESSIRQALRSGIAQATDDLDELDQAMASMGYGKGEGAPQQGGSKENKKALADKLKKFPRMKEIMKLAGRFRMIAAQVQTEKVRRGAGELSEIESGSALDRMLPSELVALTDKRRRLDFFRRWLEEQTLQYRLEDKDPIGLGPVVVCIDDSGSMNGAPETWAKALALALLDIARKQKRAFAFCTFSHVLGQTFVEEKARSMTPAEIVERLAYTQGGGTSWTPPLDWATEQIDRDPTLKKADVVLVTDDQCSMRDQDLAKINRWREKNSARVWGIAVGPAVHGRVRNMSGFCDRVFELGEIVSDGPEKNEDEALRAVLAI